MQSRTKGIVVLIGLALVLGVVFLNVVGPQLQAIGFTVASDAARIKGTISIGGDNYLGYWFLTDRELTQRLRQRGYALSWTNDQGDYAERHKKLAEARYDMVVLPINSYLFHGQATRYPGVIPVVLSESKGADSIVGYTERITGQSDRPPTINDLNNANLKICFTPDSPSDFLLNVAIAHFALDELKTKGPWIVSTKGSEDAYNRLRRRECDAAVVWEPDVSKALGLPGTVSLFGSDQVSQMIVDVFVVRRQLVRDNPDMVDAFFDAYFETLAYYSTNRDQMASLLAKDPAFGSPEAAQRAIDRVAWVGRADNCRDWFNVGLPGIQPVPNREKTVDTISQVVDVMIRVGDVAADPVEGNPYRITNSEVLTRLCARPEIGSDRIGARSVAAVFGPLRDEEWAQLKTVGRLRVVPISFDASTARLTREGAALIDEIATALTQNFPRYRVLIKGHTAPSAEEGPNVTLSEERALAVRDYLVRVYGIDANRLHGAGFGSREPLLRQRGEGELSYRNRLARVEIVLLEDNR